MARRLLLAPLLALGLAAPAHAGWEQPVGGQQPLNRLAGVRAFDTDVATVAGRPVVAWTEGGTGSPNTLRVSRLNGDGVPWQPLGGILNANPAAVASSASVADVGGIPHVAWTESVGGAAAQLRVQRFVDGTWAPVGPVLNRSTAQNASAPSITAVGGVAHVAWTEGAGGAREIVVARFDGTAWPTVGGPVDASTRANAADPTVMRQDADGASLAAVGGVPHVAWREATQPATLGGGQSFVIRVARLQSGAWVEPAPVPDAVAGESAFAPSLTAVGSAPYVAWSEDADAGGNVVGRLSVARLPAPSGTWEDLGAVQADPAASALRPDVAALGGTAVVAWQEFGGGRSQLRASRLGPDGFSELVGGPSPINDLPDGAASDASLTSIGGVPYVSWSERVDADGRTEARVARLEPEILEHQTVASETRGTLYARVRTFGLGLPLAIDLGPEGGTLVRRLVEEPTDDLEELFVTVRDLRPQTEYVWRVDTGAGLDGPDYGPEQRFRTDQSGPTGATVPGAGGDPGDAGGAGAGGTVGDAGATGPTGPAQTGATGDTGASGDSGTTGGSGGDGGTGPEGDPGSAGSPGAGGDTGASGDAGDEGPRGEEGAPGVPGPEDTGPQGDPGPAGPPGDAGPRGPGGTPGGTGGRGPAGPGGPRGATGAPGAVGADGSARPRLGLVLLRTSRTARTGARTPFAFLLSGPAVVTLEIRRAGRVVARVERAAPAGRSTIAWGGTAGGRRAPTGRYVVGLRAVDAAGRTATAFGSVTVRSVRRAASRR